MRATDCSQLYHSLQNGTMLWLITGDVLPTKLKHFSSCVPVGAKGRI